VVRARLHCRTSVRSICRRVERRIVRLGNSESVSDWTRKYLNRLSDLLFVLGRALNKREGHGDVPWAHKKARAIG
jgi:cob(I)alamin adenosyltransferase